MRRVRVRNERRGAVRFVCVFVRCCIVFLAWNREYFLDSKHPTRCDLFSRRERYLPSESFDEVEDYVFGFVRIGVLPEDDFTTFRVIEYTAEYT